MGLAVVTIAAGGLPVVETTRGFPVSEAANGRGVAVTKVTGKPALPVTFETIGIAATGPTLDPATLTNATLSNGNLTATHSTNTNNSGARGLYPKSAGKYYFEFRVIEALGSSNNLWGILASTASYTNAQSFINSTIMYQSSWVASNGVGSIANLGGAIVNGEFLGIAVDLTARLFWIRRSGGNWNGSGTANPATGVGGITVTPTLAMSPVIGFGPGVSPGDASTINYGTTAYANAAPSGFVNWPAS
jgi:hypothetical protein